VALASATVRVFVSSTFSEFVAERNLLNDAVFPRLRELCARYGATFQAVDLRWGVPEDAALDHSVIPICLEEVRRSQRLSPRPNFLLLLGERYGWKPLPDSILATELDALLDGGGLDAAQRAELADWYRRDENAIPPVYVLRSRAPNSGEAQPAHWTTVESRLRAALTSLLAGGGDAPELQRVFDRSATHLEIVEGILRTDNPERHVHCFFRALDPPRASAEDDSARHALEELKSELRSRLGANVHEFRAHWIGDGPDPEYLSTLSSQIHDTLARLIEAELSPPAELWGLSLDEDPGLAGEREFHAVFESAQAGSFLGRSADLATLHRSVEERATSGGRIIVVTGSSGSGKSALLARFVADRRGDGAAVIARFVGVTGRSTELKRLLIDLCLELDRAYGEGPYRQETPTEERAMAAAVAVEEAGVIAQAEFSPAKGEPDWTRASARIRGWFAKFAERLPEVRATSLAMLEDDALRDSFARRLWLASAERPLVIVLDGVDQLDATSGASRLDWLPEWQPPHVTILVSTADRNTAQSLMTGRRAVVVELDAMPIAEIEAIADAALAAARRTLTDSQRVALRRACEQACSPLHARLAAQLTARWPSGHPPEPLAGTIEGIIKQTVDWLIDARHHGRFLVERTLAYLAASRFGLAEAELLDLLSSSELVMDEWRRRSPHSPRAERLPAMVWLRLFADIEPYLAGRQASGISLLCFAHPAFQRFVELKLLSGHDGHARRSELARYFSSSSRAALSGEQRRGLRELERFAAVASPHSFRRDDAGGTRFDSRAVVELPWQLACAEQWPELKALLLDVDYLAAARKEIRVDPGFFWRQLEQKGRGDPVKELKEIAQQSGAPEEIARALQIAEAVADAGHAAQLLPLARRAAAILDPPRFNETEAALLRVQMRIAGELALSADPSAENDLRAALQRSQRLGGAAARFAAGTLNLSLSTHLRNRGDLTGAMIALQRAGESTDEDSAPGLALAIAEGILDLSRDLGEGDILLCAREVERLLPVLKHGNSLATSWRVQARILAEVDEVDAARELAQKSVALCEAIGDQSGLKAGHVALAALAGQVGDEQAMVNRLCRHFFDPEAAAQAGLDRLPLGVPARQGLAYFFIRQEWFPVTLRLLRDAGAALRRGGDREGVTENLSLRLVATRWMFRRDLEAQVLDEAIAFFDRDADDYRARALRQRALLSQGVGELDVALKFLQQEETVRRTMMRSRDADSRLIAESLLAACLDYQNVARRGNLGGNRYWRQPLEHWRRLGGKFAEKAPKQVIQLREEAIALLDENPAAAVAKLLQAASALKPQTRAAVELLDIVLRIQEAAYDLDGALRTQRRITEILRPSGYVGGWFLDAGLNNEGMLLEEMLRYEEALATFREVEVLCRDRRDLVLVRRAIGNQARVKVVMRNPKGALPLWRTFHRMSQDLNETDAIKFVADELKKVELALGADTPFGRLLLGDPLASATAPQGGAAADLRGSAPVAPTAAAHGATSSPPMPQRSGSSRWKRPAPLMVIALVAAVLLALAVIVLSLRKTSPSSPSWIGLPLSQPISPTKGNNWPGTTATTAMLRGGRGKKRNPKRTKLAGSRRRGSSRSLRRQYPRS